MDVAEQIKKYINGDSRMMQIATLDGDQPWICTVYYVADDDLNLYWLSLPSRRHSQEIAKHDKVAATIPVKFEQPIIGVQVEGVAEEVTDKTIIASVMKKYVAKYGSGKDFYDNFVAGKNQHHLYLIRPHLFVLLDEVNFSAQGRIEWQPKEQKENKQK